MSKNFKIFLLFMFSVSCIILYFEGENIKESIKRFNNQCLIVEEKLNKLEQGLGINKFIEKKNEELLITAFLLKGNEPTTVREYQPGDEKGIPISFKGTSACEIIMRMYKYASENGYSTVSIVIISTTTTELNGFIIGLSSFGGVI